MQTTLTQEQSPPGAAPSPTLMLLFSGTAGVLTPPPRRVLLGDGALALHMGREPPGPEALPLPHDPRASRHHATLRVLHGAGADTVVLLDRGSKNGSFVNGQRVHESPLRDGDVVRIGDSLLLLRAWPPQLDDAPVPGLRGSSPAVCALRAAIHRVASTPLTVLLQGESGTGKEVAARGLHLLSGRPGPLVAVNCAAIPRELAESQLFGHVAGAFSGARAAHAGLFRSAHGGTLFLDELGELPLELQPKLLRALEERAVTPVGAVAALPCDVRLIAATNRDLAAEVAAGRFRGDLYARLLELPMTLPPLRQRREDVLPLLCHALAESGPAPRLSARLAAELLAHAWPYNVRELLKVAARLRLEAGAAPVVDVDVAAWLTRVPAPDSAGTAAVDNAPEHREPAPLPDREELLALLRLHRGNVSRIAQAAGRSRRQVDRWLHEHGLDPAPFRDPRQPD